MTAAPAQMQPVPGATSVAARTVLIGGLAALGIGAYVSIRPEQPWILLLTTLMVALGTDGLVKSHPRWVDLRPIDSVVYAFLPALAVLGAGLFIDHAIESYARQGWRWRLQSRLRWRPSGSTRLLTRAGGCMARSGSSWRWPLTWWRFRSSP
ncbi:MAG: hypothetical protein IPO34_10300 [Dehalococcoidia bacterium]|nr:hypothetical protein [Dehalococcoidia bacterium]